MSKTAIRKRLTVALVPGALALVVSACNLPGVGVGVSATGSTTTTSTSTSTTTSTTTTTTTTVPPTTTTTTTGPPQPTCGGQQVLVADGTTWDCTFDSEFTGSTLDLTKWTPLDTANDSYTSGNTACFMDGPNNISVGGGFLSLTARKEAAPFTCTDPKGSFTTQYTSGSVTTSGLWAQTFGRVEVMAKVPSSSIPGLQSAIWMYPQSGTLGEMDVAEMYSNQPGLAIPYIHYNADPTNTNKATNTNVVTATDCQINPNQFNDYVIEWSSTTITMIYNGQACLIDHYNELLGSPGAPFNQPFFINLTQALGIGTNAFDPTTTVLPAVTEVEYVRAWQAES